jgi:hypothetical protein
VPLAFPQAGRRPKRFVLTLFAFRQSVVDAASG